MKSSYAVKISKRLQSVIAARKIPKKEFAELGQITAQTMSDYLSGKTLPNAKALINWAENTGLNANWLLVGEGPMFRDEQSKAPGDSLTPKTQTGQELLEIKLALQEAEASKEEIKQALLDYVSGGRAPQDSATGTDNDSG